MKKLLILVSLLLLTFSISVFAEDASMDNSDDGAKQMAKFEKHEKALNLSTKQKEEMKKIREENRKEMKGLITEKQEIRKELNALMDADDPDMGKVETKVKELSAVKNKLMMNRLNKAKKMNKVLTKKQRKKIKEIKAKRKEKRMEKMKEMKKEMKDKMKSKRPRMMRNK